MASVRAEGVAEALWELKRLDKLATFTEVATRAGFKPGAGGRTLLSCLTTVQRDWPHLHWWRAIPDDRMVAKESEHSRQLASGGFELTEATSKKDMLELIAVEDSPTGIQSAKAAGYQVIAVPFTTPTAELEEADFTVDTFYALGVILGHPLR